VIFEGKPYELDEVPVFEGVHHPADA